MILFLTEQISPSHITGPRTSKQSLSSAKCGFCRKRNKLCPVPTTCYHALCRVRAVLHLSFHISSLDCLFLCLCFLSLTACSTYDYFNVINLWVAFHRTWTVHFQSFFSVWCGSLHRIFLVNLFLIIISFNSAIKITKIKLFFSFYKNNSINYI